MYTLMSGFWKYMFQKDEFFVLILGLDNAGKTTYLEQTKTKFTKHYKGMNPSKITTTVGLNRIDSTWTDNGWDCKWARPGNISSPMDKIFYESIVHGLTMDGIVNEPVGKIDIGNIRLNFWDLGGQEELQSLWDKYYAESHAIIYLVDASDSERLEESKETFQKMIGSDVLCGVPLLLLANKQDLQDTIPVSEIKSAFHEVARDMGRRDCKVMGSSALNGDGVNEGIEWIVQCVKRNSIERPPTLKDIT